MPPTTDLTYIGLGANLGDALGTLRQAIADLGAAPGVAVTRVSPFYASAPIDSSGDDYVNAVAEIETSLSPHALLAALQSIEAAHGRQRPYRNAPRTLDLDLLLYADQHSDQHGHDAQVTVDTPSLTVPHPRLHQRAFVLAPLSDLRPDLIVPGVQRSVASLLTDVADQHVRRLG